ncbi:hypothetical protein PV326_006137 [Microctonus aethiopoides]|nr:hypothetical protein PV326_006137 [Microctonus aethiopoides]
MAACETSLVINSGSGAIPKKNIGCTIMCCSNNSCVCNTRSIIWQQRLFGKQLLRCNQMKNFNYDIDKLSCIDVSNFVDDLGVSMCEVIGIYFSFINPSATCDDFTKQLTELYANVNSIDASNGDYSDKELNKRKRFEVVHIVLWNNVADVLDFNESFKNHVAELPWLAVPNQDYERKVYVREITNDTIVFLCVMIGEKGHWGNCRNEYGETWEEQGKENGGGSIDRSWYTMSMEKGREAKSEKH